MKLTDRQTEIYEARLAGYTRAEVGNLLGISVKTVISHMESVRSKLGSDCLIPREAALSAKKVDSLVPEMRYGADKDLSPTEASILKKLAAGMTQESIAAATGRSIKTIKAQTANARWKLGANHTTHAVALALINDLI